MTSSSRSRRSSSASPTKKAAGQLETAVVTYKNDAGVELKLVSAIHIGERSYFEGLAKDFEADDAVLYELVKEKDAPLPGPEAMRRKAAEGGGDGATRSAQLQRFLKDTLNLEFQLDVIDYTKKNFVHADMDREAFEKAQAERGESFETMMLQQLIAAMRKPQADLLPAAGEDPEQMLKELVKLVTRPDMERQIKTFIAKQMDQMQDVAMGLDGPGGSVILTERNKAAVKVLEDTIKAGKKKISALLRRRPHARPRQARARDGLQARRRGEVEAGVGPPHPRGPAVGDRAAPQRGHRRPRRAGAARPERRVLSSEARRSG